VLSDLLLIEETVVAAAHIEKLSPDLGRASESHCDTLARMANRKSSRSSKSKKQSDNPSSLTFDVFGELLRESEKFCKAMKLTDTHQSTLDKRTLNKAAGALRAAEGVVAVQRSQGKTIEQQKWGRVQMLLDLRLKSKQNRGR